ncbi:MAG: 5-formyltetrahydrofolate cyclo-ligase [Anaerotignum sp.]|nr:5-formyltetrahydrofolate cyclo-ligase [Anaerotignum sp.]
MKKKLRTEALSKRDHIPAEERVKKSRKITEYILQSDVYKQAKVVFSFVNMGSEAETREILRQAWKDGKAVAVPKTEKGRVMVFLKIESFADLKEGRFGVLEPVSQIEMIPEKGDLFLVPGALFDSRKHRLGYGGGYYDTYFEKYQGYRKIGLAFSEQMTEKDIPTEVYDIPLDDIVTENGWEE